MPCLVKISKWFSEEDENVKSLQTDGPWTTGDQKSSLELLALLVKKDFFSRNSDVFSQKDAAWKQLQMEE